MQFYGVLLVAKLKGRVIRVYEKMTI